MRLTDAKRHSHWEDPPKRTAVLRVWKNDQENHIRSLAMTAARQINDGSEEDAADAILTLQCAKAKLAPAFPTHDQIRQVRKHLDRTEDDIQTKIGPREDITKQLRELQTTRKQLTNILHDLRNEASDTSEADDEASDDRPAPPNTPRGSTRSATPYPRRHRGHVGAASPDNDQVTARKQQLKDMQYQLTKQASTASDKGHRTGRATARSSTTNGGGTDQTYPTRNGVRRLRSQEQTRTSPTPAEERTRRHRATTHD